MLKVNDVLENIVNNSKEHCEFCKKLNRTQFKFQLKTFKEE
jgi:hypothetical protein